MELPEVDLLMVQGGLLQGHAPAFVVPTRAVGVEESRGPECARLSRCLAAEPTRVFGVISLVLTCGGPVSLCFSALESGC